MENTVKNIVSELQNYQKQKDVIYLNKSLTAIQRKIQLESIRETFAKKGINITSENLDWKTDNINESKIKFLFSSLIVNDNGVVTDVCTSGDFPIHLTLNENIYVIYEPRNLRNVPLLDRHKINNSEFFPIKKGSNYQFNGEVTYCNYYRYTKLEKFEFAIVGKESKKTFFPSTAQPVHYFFISIMSLFFAVLFEKNNIKILYILFFILTLISFGISYIGFIKHVNPVFSFSRSKYLGKEFIKGDPGFINGGCIGCLMIIVLFLIAGVFLMIFGIN